MKYVLILLFIFNFANAHKLNLFITTNDNNSIEIYSYFASGSACKHCEVIIKNNDKIILKDSLDNKGKYNYKSEYKNIEVIVDATGGHKASEKLQIANIHNENLKDHIKSEEKSKYINIIIGLFLIVLIFLFLKKIKKKNEE